MYQLHPIKNFWTKGYSDLQTNTLVKCSFVCVSFFSWYFISVTSKESCFELRCIVALFAIEKSFTLWLVETFHVHRQLLFWKDLECPLESSDIWDQLCAARLWLLVPDLSVFYVVVIQQWPSISQIVPFDKSSFCIHVLHTLPSANSVYARVLTIQSPFKNYQFRNDLHTDFWFKVA